MSNKQEMLYGLCMVAMALQLSAICTEHWGTASASSSGLPVPSGMSGETSMGLWKMCGDIWNKQQELDTCMHLPPDGTKTFPKNSLYAVRAFALMGVILVFLALTCMMYMKEYKKCQFVGLLAGGVASIIASVVWVAKMLKVKPDDESPDIKFSPGYSFYLNLGGGLVALVVAAAYYYSDK